VSKRKTGKSPSVPKTTSISLLSGNVNSIIHRTDEIATRLYNSSIDIFAAQETKLSNSVLDTQIGIANYEVFRRDRTKGGGGGVCLYIHQSLCPLLIKDSPPQNLEIVGCKVKNKLSFSVFSVYKPPSTEKVEFIANITDYIQKVTCPEDRIIIAGDFNLNLLDQKDSKLIDEICETLSLRQTVSISEATHKSSIIDHIYIRGFDNSATVLHPPIERHHKTIGITIPLTSTEKTNLQPSQTSAFKWYNWKQTNWDNLEGEIFVQDLKAKVSSSESPDDVWEIIKNSIISAIENNVPKKLIPIPKSKKPAWFTKDIKTAVSYSHSLWRKLKKMSTNNSAYENLKAQHRKSVRNCRKLTIQSKRRIFEIAFQNPTNTRPMWKMLKSLYTSRQLTIPELISKDGETFENDKSKADCLAAQYESVFAKEEESMPAFITTDSDITPVCSHIDVFALLNEIDSTKAMGHDRIPGKVLKRVKASISESLAHLFSISLRHGQPQDWLKSEIVPVPKCKGANQPEQFRPISLLCIVAKIFDRWVLSLLKAKIDTCLPSNQYGFREKRSTTEALLSFETIIQKGFESCTKGKKPTAVHIISIDCMKAFDRIPHNTILHTLENFHKFPKWSLRWAYDQICNRNTRVKVGTSYSRSFRVASGVPQGCPSSAPLFVLSIAKLSQVKLSKGAEIILYADDTVYIKSGNCAKTAETIEADLHKIQLCLEECGQTLNTSKTRGMMASIAPTPQTPANISINGIPIRYESSIKYLGVLFDQKMTMKDHVKSSVIKAKRLMGATIGVLQKYRQNQMIRRVWTGIIRPILSYSLWLTNGKNKESDARIERLQLTAARAALNRYDDDSLLLAQLKWHSFEKLAWSQRVRLAYSYSHGYSIPPENVFKYAQQKSVRTRQLQHSLHFECTIESRSESSRRSGCKMIEVSWNRLSETEVTSTRACFKRRTSAKTQ